MVSRQNHLRRVGWLAIACSVALGGGIPAVGEPKQENPVRLRLSGGSVPAGGVLALALELDESSTVPATLVVDLVFDSSVLNLVGAVAGEGAAARMFTFQETESGATFLYYGFVGSLQPGTLATMIFETADEVSNGPVGLENGESSAATEDAENLDVVLEGNPITVTPLSRAHDADTDRNGRIGLSEILRVVQLFNATGLGCDLASEDGFAPGGADQSCTPHDLDYREQDWRIDLSELLRCVQFYNAEYGAYHVDAGGEDGFAAGLE